MYSHYRDAQAYLPCRVNTYQVLTKGSELGGCKNAWATETWNVVAVQLPGLADSNLPYLVLYSFPDLVDSGFEVGGTFQFGADE